MTIEEYVNLVANSLRAGRPKRSSVNSVIHYLSLGMDYTEAVIKTAWANKYRREALSPQVKELRKAVGDLLPPPWIVEAAKAADKVPSVVSIKVEITLSNGQTVKYKI